MGDRPRMVRVDACWSYVDEQNVLLYYVVKGVDQYGEKIFYPARPDPAGGPPLIGIEGIRRVIYRLPEVLACTGVILIVEGEKDVDRVFDIGPGWVATCNPGGGGKWDKSYSESLRGKHIILIPDNDKTGEQHVNVVGRSLLGVAASYRVCRLPGLPPKGDVSDYLDVLHRTPAELLEELGKSISWEPPPNEKNGVGQGQGISWALGDSPVPLAAGLSGGRSPTDIERHDPPHRALPDVKSASSRMMNPATMAGIAMMTGTSRWGAVRLSACLQALVAAADGERNNVLCREAFKIGQGVGGNQIGEVHAKTELEQACKRIGLFGGNEEEKTRGTICRCLEEGARCPVRPRAEERSSYLLNENDVIRYIAERTRGGIEWPVTTVIHLKNGKEVVVPDRDAVANLEAVLVHCGIRMQRNEMTKQVEITLATGERYSGDLGDAVIRECALRCGLQSSRESYDRHIIIILGKNSYHPVRDWLDLQIWDGKSRLDDLYQTLTLREGKDPVFVKALLRRWLISAVAGIYETRTSAKMEGVLTLVGPQGCGKTSWLKSLVPDKDWFLDGGIYDGSVDSVRQITSVWISELGELEYTFRKADIGQLKGFLSKTADTYRQPYARHAEVHPRRTVFAASANPTYILRDPTGSRRYWVVAVTACNAWHGISISQLWAEVKTLYQAGERWYLTKDEEKSLFESNKGHQEPDPVVEALEACFSPCTTGRIRQDVIRDVVKDALGQGYKWGRVESNVLMAKLREWADELRIVDLPIKDGWKCWPVQMSKIMEKVAVNSELFHRLIGPGRLLLGQDNKITA